MRLYHNRTFPGKSERGIALVTAIIACAILLALGLLVIQLSTGDVHVSARAVADKKALSAAESGIHRLMQNFDPENRSGVSSQQVDPNTDPSTVFSYGPQITPPTGPPFLPMAGYSIGGGQAWGQQRYEVVVVGESPRYNARVEIETGMGYGPVDISTISR